MSIYAMHKFRSTICFICFIILTKAEINIRNASFYTMGGSFSHLLNPAVYMTSPSVINSCSLCLDNPDCSSFLYNTKTQQMQTLASIGTPIGTADGDWQYYILKKEPRVCEGGWEKFEESCYLFSLFSGTWDSGKTFCEGEGGHLVEISSLAEDNFIRDYVRNRGLTAYETRDSWIGGTDVDVENTFVWTGSGQTFTYINWGPGNPDNSGGNQHCVILFQESDYKWHDTQCTNTNSYICEK